MLIRLPKESQLDTLCANENYVVQAKLVPIGSEGPEHLQVLVEGSYSPHNGFDTSHPILLQYGSGRRGEDVIEALRIRIRQVLTDIHGENVEVRYE